MSLQFVFMSESYVHVETMHSYFLCTAKLQAACNKYYAPHAVRMLWHTAMGCPQMHLSVWPSTLPICGKKQGLGIQHDATLLLNSNCGQGAEDMWGH